MKSYLHDLHSPRVIWSPRSVPERAAAAAPREDPAHSCSPITLEYAEELLLMAYDGRCAVMDVSAVPKECPSGAA